MLIIIGFIVYKKRGRVSSGSGRRKPKQVQVTPAEFHKGIYCGRLRLAAEPAKRNFLRFYTVRANCKR